MSVPDDHSYFSRFLLKFVEIIAAGLATAASGYLIAHLSGALSSPAPAAAFQVIPSTSTVSGSLPAQPIPPPISANINEQRLSPQEVNAPRVARPARKTVNTTKAEPPLKHSDSATNATQALSRTQTPIVPKRSCCRRLTRMVRWDPRSHSRDRPQIHPAVQLSRQRLCRN